MVSYFVRELRNKDNAALNHAADCLARLGDKGATLALINALVTEHKFQVSAGGGPGSINTAFGSGGGTFSSGKTAMVQKKLLENSSVRSALTSMYPGVNYNYDIGTGKRGTSRPRRPATSICAATSESWYGTDDLFHGHTLGAHRRLFAVRARWPVCVRLGHHRDR